MLYGVCICNNLREPKNIHGPRNILECFPRSFLCSETVSLQEAPSQTYEVLSKIYRIGAAIYTAVVVARSCEFRVLLRRFAATA
jgi:hypothetical protein